MIITLKKDAPKEEVNKLVKSFENKGLSVTMIYGDNYNVFGLVGDTSKVDEKLVKAHPFVENVTRIAAPYKPTVYFTRLIRLLMLPASKSVAMKKSL